MAKRCPLIIIRLLLIVSLALSPALAQMYHPWSSAKSQYMLVCNDYECHHRGKIIAESIDKKVDPCDDFYQYVCGKWHVKNPVPPDEVEWTVEEKLDIEAMGEMSKILKFGISLNEPKDVRTAKKLYQICNNLPSMSKMGPKDLQPIVKRAGLWPMFHPEHKSKVCWLDIHNHYLKYTGDAGLFSIRLNYDHKTREIMLHLSQAPAPLGLIQRYPGWSQEEEIKHQYFLLMLARLVMHKHSEPHEKDIIQDIMDVLAFRQKLNKNAQLPSIEFSPMTIKYFQSWYDIKTTSQKCGTKISWLTILRDLFEHTSVDINGDTKIIVDHRDSFANLPRILSNTPKHVIANHLHLYFIEKHIIIDKELNDGLTNLLINNGKIVGNTVARLDRPIACILAHPMKDTLGKLYIERYFSEDIRTSALYYGNKMKEMIKTHITSSSWLNSETMTMLVSKLKDLQLDMGYRNISETENIDPRTIKTTPYRAISFYAAKDNAVFISAGYFRSPVYGQYLPSAVNYGTISTFIAYEMYHALSNTHRHVEASTSKGSTEPCQYCWPEAMEKILRTKQKCFQDMYTNLEDKELEKVKPVPKKKFLRMMSLTFSKTNGANTLLENIADVMGIRTGMDAFKKVLWESHGKCRLLPHLKNLTCEKLFFISYAATYCTVSPTWRLLKHMQLGTHSTSRLRVNVPLSNMEEFKKAFECSASSRMVSKKSCYLW